MDVFIAGVAVCCIALSLGMVWLYTSSIRGDIAGVIRILHLRKPELFAKPISPWQARIERLTRTRVEYDGEHFDVPRSVLHHAKRILKHLHANWPDSRGYNTWYAVHSGKQHGWLDANFEPAQGNRIPTRMEELCSLGGVEAISAYTSVMR